MHATDDRLDFAPPPQPGLLRAFGLAVIAHLLLALALTLGLQWQRDSENVVAEAELWSAVPQEAAPRAEPVPPTPPAPPVPPPPVVRAPPQPDPQQVQRDAQIALERDRERERDKREAEERRQAQLEKERDQKRKLEAQKKREEEAARRKEEQARKLAEARRKEDERKRKQEQEAREAKRLAQLREENMRRIQGMAGSGSPDATGTAERSSGPSASYAGRVAAIIKRNTRFVETVSGDPEVEVEVRLAPDGTIVGQRLVKSSGNKARDEAVLRGIQATEKLPRDVDGRIHTPMRISVRQFG